LRPGCRSRSEAVNLRPFADAAEDHARAQLLVRSVDADALQDLGREFAGRREHERARSAARGGLEQLQQGSTKAAVLPVPVWAPASRSRPLSTGGIAAAWIGVGVE
jgi:hypothetical protein